MTMLRADIANMAEIMMTMSGTDIANIAGAMMAMIINVYINTVITLRELL